jgi:hypothetical protein
VIGDDFRNITKNCEGSFSRSWSGLPTQWQSDRMRMQNIIGEF